MKKILLASLLALAALPLRAAELQFVESVPVDTVYGSSLTARPQAVWLDMVNSAAKTLDLEEFYISDKSGEALSPVLDAVKAAVKRGVRVRLVVGSVMMSETAASLPALKAAGVDVRVIDFKKVGGGIQHSKFFVADGKEVYVGSQNFDWRSLSHVHEIGLRIKSEKAAAEFEKVFKSDWSAAGGADAKKIFSRKGKADLTAAKPEKALLGGAEVSYHLAFGPAGFIPKGDDVEIDQLLKLISSATDTIHGQVMTYALAEYGSKRWPELDEAFRTAAARGVKVELVFADWGMGGKADRDIKALAKTENISVKISSLPQAASGFIPYARVEHLKYLVVDGKTAYVTTSNWGPGYFLTTRSAAVFIEGAPAAAVLEDVFFRTWNGPYVQPVDPLKEYKPVKRN
jgi:phosphatidylserine/phosphatidylglycerophosphate/cardiolipin synthase-like enzyme